MKLVIFIIFVMVFIFLIIVCWRLLINVVWFRVILWRFLKVFIRIFFDRFV